MSLPCLYECIAHELERVRIAVKNTMQKSRGPPPLWDTMEWQKSKRLIARAIASCLCRTIGCEVYIIDVHGGEPSSGLGGKDIDLVIDCPPHFNTDSVEETVESLVAAMLEDILADNPYRVLGVPNLVELHTSKEYLFEKYLRSGPPYVFRLC